MAAGNYQELINNLDSLKDYCYEASKQHLGRAWGDDVATLYEAMDIISDYEKVAPEAARMSQHYETVAKPIHKSGVWVCPACGKKIPTNHSHCHWCGKKVGWKKGGRVWQQSKH